MLAQMYFGFLSLVFSSFFVCFFTESVHLNLEMNDTETDKDNVWVCLSELQLLLVISTSHISKTFIHI